jgi:hypothetical protein
MNYSKNYWTIDDKTVTRGHLKINNDNNLQGFLSQFGFVLI